MILVNTSGENILFFYYFFASHTVYYETFISIYASVLMNDIKQRGGRSAEKDRIFPNLMRVWGFKFSHLLGFRTGKEKNEKSKIWRDHEISK